MNCPRKGVRWKLPAAILLDCICLLLLSGNISVKNSGPGAWTSGSNLAVGEGATFVFPVKDAFNNVKKRSTGAASQAEFEQAFGQFDARIRNHVHSLSMNYNTETGYANFTFIPTTLGTWPLFVGKEEAGILGTPYEYRVTKSGPISSQNCLAVWYSNSTVIAGNLAYVFIYLKDMYDNAVNVSTGWSDVINFTLSVTNSLGNTCQFCTSLTAKPGAGYEIAMINITLAGYYKLNILDGKTVLKGSPLRFTVIAGPVSVENCTAYWLNNINSFMAGEQATLKVRLIDSYNNSITASTGQRTFIPFNVFSNSSSGVLKYNRFNVVSDGNPGYERITFTPVIVGDFLLHVRHNYKEIQGSPFSFNVTAGVISIPDCQGSWANNTHSYTAGEQAVLQVLLMDAYSNNISLSTGRTDLMKFSASIMDITGQQISVNALQISDESSAYEYIVFNCTSAGDFSLQLEKNGMTVAGSPFPFHVDPGNLLPSACEGFWPYHVSTFEAGETGTFGIIYKDAYDNTLNASDISISISAYIQNASGTGNFTVLQINPNGGFGFGFVTFTSLSSGSLLMHAKVNGTEIKSSPFPFDVIPGPIYAPNCQGSWLGGTNAFQAGDHPSFRVLLVDGYNNTVSMGTNSTDYLNFTAFSMTNQGSKGLSNVTMDQESSLGYQLISFPATVSGNFSLHVEHNGTSIEGSPFPYSIIPVWKCFYHQ